MGPVVNVRTDDVQQGRPPGAAVVPSPGSSQSEKVSAVHPGALHRRGHIAQSPALQLAAVASRVRTQRLAAGASTSRPKLPRP